MKTNPLTIAGITIMCFLFITVAMIGCPMYRVYTARKAGEAILAKAESSRLVAITDAKAKKESAAYLKDADIKRAEGIAQANAIIGQSLKDNESYLRWLFIDKMDMAQSQMVYIPTEAGMPILEAGRLPYNQQKKLADSLKLKNE